MRYADGRRGVERGRPDHALDTVREVHEDYVQAGVEVITTNIFTTAGTCWSQRGWGSGFAS